MTGIPLSTAQRCCKQHRFNHYFSCLHETRLPMTKVEKPPPPPPLTSCRHKLLSLDVILYRNIKYHPPSRRSQPAKHPALPVQNCSNGCPKTSSIVIRPFNQLLRNEFCNHKQSFGHMLFRPPQLAGPGRPLQLLANGQGEIAGSRRCQHCHASRRWPR